MYFSSIQIHDQGLALSAAHLNSHFHLHGTDDGDDLALLDWISDGDLQLDDLSLHGRAHVAGDVGVGLGLAAKQKKIFVIVALNNE